MYVYMYVMYVVCYSVICTYYCVTRNTRCFRHQISIVVDEIMKPLKVSAPLHSTKKLMHVDHTSAVFQDSACVPLAGHGQMKFIRQESVISFSMN